MNTISDNGRESHVYWLIGGAQDATARQESAWTLLPPWFPLTALWLGIVGLAASLWKGARHAAVVTEPLPIIVRAAETVEGQGRLYRRASGNTARAAAILREASLQRIKQVLGLSRHISDETASAMIDVPGADALLRGPVPTDSTELVALAQRLSTLESEIRARTSTVPPHPTDVTQSRPTDDTQRMTRHDRMERPQ